MKLIYKNKKINFIVNSNFQKLKDEKSSIMFLHGWGGSTKSFLGPYNYFSNFYPVISLDFWGFGESDEPDENYKLDDYVLLVKTVLQHLNVKNVILVGHSFGGRVALKLSTDNKLKIEKLILVDSAGIKPKFSLLKYCKIKKYKIKKYLVIHKILSANCLTNAGSMDYKLMKEHERGIFIRIINEYLEDYAKKVSVPTLIIWGQKDKETPLYMAKKLNKLINKSKLVVLDGGHYAYLENHLQFCNEINDFIGE